METLLKFTLPLITGIVLWFLKASKERSTIGLAISAEISALCEIAEARGYLTALREKADLLRLKEPEDESPMAMCIKVPEHYCQVYTNNLDTIGKLDADEAELVVRFYQFIDSVVQDVTEGGLLAQGVAAPEIFDEAIKIFEKALSTADQLTDLRMRKAKQPWFMKVWRMFA